MQVVLLRRSRALAPFVSSIGYAEGNLPHARERVLPTGAMQLLVNLDADTLHYYGDGDPAAVQRTPGAALKGVDARPAVIDPAEQRAVLWVSFRPGGGSPFFPAPAAATRDQLVDIGELWGRDGAVLRERLLAAGSPDRRLRVLESLLLARVGTPRPDPAVAAAVTALHRGAPVAEVADSLGWTRKRLVRVFTDQVGLTPKRFARVRRFQRLIRLVAAGGPAGGTAGGAARGGPDWARYAAECGYHDQAHMIHDFRAFAGLSPTEYAPRSAAARNHIPLPG